VDFGLLARKLSAKLDEDRTRYLDASGLATKLMGDTVYANFILVGAAIQLGWLPLGLQALQKSIELNGVQVERNAQAVAIGRLWVHDQAAFEKLLTPVSDEPTPTIADVVTHRQALLTEYQDSAYASRYVRLVERVRDAERLAGGDGALTMAVAQGFARLMAYKDEYEVARLYSDPEFRQRLKAEFDDARELRLNLAPPLWARTDPTTGQPRKSEYGPWVFPLLSVLARFKRLRGTIFDPFGYTTERRAERALVNDYEQRIEALLPALRPVQLPLALRIAEVADTVRGFGPVKEKKMSQATEAWRALELEWTALDRPATTMAA
jgi:indolepyruvate ferredoxin oxidoreductase